jgi:hypothetical protein
MIINHLIIFNFNFNFIFYNFIKYIKIIKFQVIVDNFVIFSHKYKS